MHQVTGSMRSNSSHAAPWTVGSEKQTEKTAAVSQNSIECGISFIGPEQTNLKNITLTIKTALTLGL